MTIYRYIPQAMMDTVPIPLLKDKKGNVTDKNNYRPVSITCIISKSLELITLDQYGHLLQSSQNQFGFKKKLGTDLCVLLLNKSLITIDLYLALYM